MDHTDRSTQNLQGDDLISPVDHLDEVCSKRWPLSSLHSTWSRLQIPYASGSRLSESEGYGILLFPSSLRTDSTGRLAMKRLRFRNALISKRCIPPTVHHLLPRYPFELNANRDASNSVNIEYAGDSGLVGVPFTRSRTATVVVNCLTLRTASSTPTPAIYLTAMVLKPTIDCAGALHG